MKNKMNKSALPLFTLLFILALSACQMLNTSINTIQENPEEYDGTEVTVRGTVEESVNLVVLKYYVLNDGTGSIYVKTKDAVPLKGETVRVTGKVNQVLKVADRQMTGLVEIQRK